MSRVRQNSANIRFVRDSEKGISAERKHADSLQILKEVESWDITNFLSKVFFQLCSQQAWGQKKRSKMRCACTLLNRASAQYRRKQKIP